MKLIHIILFFFFSSRRRHTSCALVTGVRRVLFRSEEGGDDVKSSWPLRVGLHTCYNGDYSGQPLREEELISKSRLSSDRSLQLESVKAESLVIADQHAAVNTFPGLVHTARHTQIGRASCRERVCQYV